MYTAILRDISLRKQTEAALHLAAAAFDTQEGMIITDANGVILRVNQAFTKITGYTSEEAVGQTPRLLKSGRHDADFYREMWETLNRTGSWQGEVWDRRKNGEIYPKWLSITAVRGRDGAVSNYIGSQTDISERKAAEAQIQTLAFYDPLTQLPNRRLLDDRLEQSVAACKRSGNHGAAMFIDLDNFKSLNDIHGHKVGDLLLMEVARRLASCVREVDTVARFGGDEFVVLVSELDGEESECTIQANIVAEKIRGSLSGPYWLTPNPEGTKKMIVYRDVGASIGVALYTNNASAESILKWADKAMYQAKEAGRNQICFYDPE
jgi:diguanylate cyclase (GGDEF)-like protein/PAS domain S-box-containing protein